MVDANIAAAALLRPGGWTARELERRDVVWLAPAFLLEELKEHAASYAAKAECSLAEWRRRTRAFAAGLEVIAAEALVAAADDALVRAAEAVDPDDAVYFAALVGGEADFLWTRDARLLAAFPGRAVLVVPQAP